MATTAAAARRLLLLGPVGSAAAAAARARVVVLPPAASARLAAPSRRATTTSTAGGDGGASSSAAGPVLTFLSPGPAASRAAVAFLRALFRLPRVDRASDAGTIRDPLDELHFGSGGGGGGPSWDSVACACPASGTVLHFLSPSVNGSDDEGSKGTADHGADGAAPLRLVAVHGSHSSSPPSADGCRRALAECRRRLARDVGGERQLFPSSTLEGRLRGTLLRVATTTTGGGSRRASPHPSWLLERNPCAGRPSPPLFDPTPWRPHSGDADDGDAVANDGEGAFEVREGAGKLRELALPFFPGTTSSSSLPSKLSESSLSRPLPGLYQCAAATELVLNRSATACSAANPGLILRPLPAAEEDLRLSPPSLVFQCESLDEMRERVERLPGGGGRAEKIGWRGHGRKGSLVARHPSVPGLDVRISEGAGDGSAAWAPEAMFAEAQDALLAGSLAELQSAHVASEGNVDGGGTGPAREDPNTLKQDCWVEWKANVRRPGGFFRSRPPGTSVAKLPSLPYE